MALNGRRESALSNRLLPKWEHKVIFWYCPEQTKNNVSAKNVQIVSFGFGGLANFSKFAHLHFWASGKFASFDALSGKLAPRRNYRFLRAALSTPRNDTRTEWASHQQICSNCSDTRKDANLQGANLHNWQQKKWQICTFALAFMGLLGHYID